MRLLLWSRLSWQLRQPRNALAYEAIGPEAGYAYISQDGDTFGVGEVGVHDGLRMITIDLEGT